MIASRIVGDDWRGARLFFDDVANAEADDIIEIQTADDDNGTFTGQFRDRGNSEVVLEDALVDGRFISDGLRPLIVFTRRHAGGNVTTRYIGRVIELADETTVMIRGRFTRATTNADGSVTISSGDHETEKPT